MCCIHQTGLQAQESALLLQQTELLACAEISYQEQLQAQRSQLEGLASEQVQAVLEQQAAQQVGLDQWFPAR